MKDEKGKGQDKIQQRISKFNQVCLILGSVNAVSDWL